MKFANSANGNFDKESKVKYNKFVGAGVIKDLKESAQNCWKSIAPSRDKSTQWLLINHALPVENRIHRNDNTICRRCQRGPEDLPHVFGSCSRAQGIYRDTTHKL